MDTTAEVGLILLLLVFSAIYAGMEAALYSQSEIKLRARQDAGDTLPRILELWLTRPYDILTTLLVGNNLVNITASVLAADITSRALPDQGWGLAVAAGATTMVVLIVGEVVPKTLAKADPDWFFRFLGLVQLSYWVFWPASKILVWIAEKTLARMGSAAELTHQTVTEEDIEQLVRIGKKDGSLDQEATRLLQGVLGLDDKVAREVMVPRTEVEAFDVATPVADVLQKSGEIGFSRYPVYAGEIDQIVGVLYIKDLLPVVLAGTLEGKTLEPFIRDPIIRPENTSLHELLVQMKRERVHMVILASEYGGMEGLVTLEDIVEEVFGEIYDEHDDVGEDSIRPTDDGGWAVDGVATMDDLEQEIGLVLSGDDEDYETITGMLMMAAKTMPVEGFTHEQDGWSFEVVSADSTRVVEVLVNRMASEPDLESEEREEAPEGQPDQG